MAVSSIIDSTALSIEVKSGVDAKGAITYTKKSFSNLRNDVAAQNAYDVAEAIKAVLEQPTRAYFLNKNFTVVNA